MGEKTDRISRKHERGRMRDRGSKGVLQVLQIKERNKEQENKRKV